MKVLKILFIVMALLSFNLHHAQENEEEDKLSLDDGPISSQFEFIFAKKMSFNLMTGFAAYRNFSQVKMTGETGLYFKF